MSERRLWFAMIGFAPPHIVLNLSQNACMDLQESADCPTKDDDFGVSSYKVED